MNKLITTLTLMLALSGGATAAELLSPALYGNELQRCITEIRSQASADANQALRHRVTNVSKAGAWYRFEIETLALQDSGFVSFAMTECTAHRYTDTTEAAVAMTSVNGGQRLVGLN